MMKSKMTMRIVCAVLTLLLVVGMVPAQVNAASYTIYKLGDVNGDGKVSVADATLIQRYLVRSTTFSAKQKLAADVNLDGNVSILDATAIQQYCAKMIDSFDAYCDDTWVSLYAATTKKFTNVSGTVSGIAYINGSDWLVVSQSGKTVTIKTRANTTTAARDAIVVVKNGSNVYAIRVRQLGKNDITSSNKTKYNGYAYAMQLSSDPRLVGGSAVGGFYFAPGMIANPSFDLSTNIGQYNIINYTRNDNEDELFEDVEDYIIGQTRADLAEMGWGIREVSSADAKVAKGNWLIALSFNPSENYTDGKCSVSLYGVPSAFDYHWYRRVDSTSGSYWTHKCGNLAPENLTDIPENLNLWNHKVCSEQEYLDAYAGYAHAFLEYYDPNPFWYGMYHEYYYMNTGCLYPNFSYCTYSNRFSDVKADYQNAYNMEDAYVFLGYYEVGPNV